MLVSVRLTLRRLRLEALVCLGASVVLALAVHALAGQVATAPTPSAAQSWMGLVPYAKQALVVVPILVAIVLGTSLAAAELERGTAAFAWSIVPSRVRWLSETTASGAILVLVVSIPLAWASDELSGALGPLVDARSWTWADPAWSLVLVRPLVAYAVAWLVGVVVGRSLPALLTGILVASLVVGSLELGFAVGRSAVAVSIDPDTAGTLWLSDSARLPDGRVVPLADAVAIHRSGTSTDPPFVPVTLGLSKELRREVLALEIAGSLAAAGVVLLSAGMAAGHRRP